MRIASFLFVIFISTLSQGVTARAETIAEFLRAFHANPRGMMERLPSEVLPGGLVRPRGFINQKEIDATWPDRQKLRQRLMGGGPELPTAVPDEKDLAKTLVEPGGLMVNLGEMESRRLMGVTASVSPWTDSYWPMYKGLIGVRYADKNFPNAKNWLTNHSYIQSNPAPSVVASGDLNRINALSPAEKYDLAMGDDSYTLTNFAWSLGAKHQNETGFVATWMGICHGWAGAAHMLSPLVPEPVVVSSPRGIPITFYQQDVKALQSMLWANASVKTRFVGNRCNTPRPMKNAYGRILDPNCFDTNPATWHLALVNQLGIHQRPFVMDSTYDAQVWNFPLYSYQYRYFHPQSFREGASLRSAMVPLENYSLDKFREFRAPGTRYVVGVYMDVTHVNAITPTRANNVEPVYKTVRLVYDLELDANLNILGGEWYSNAHPDFLWTFDKGAQALAPGDLAHLNEGWRLGQPVPSHWEATARRASARGEPLFSFIQGLVQGATEPTPREEPPSDSPRVPAAR